MKKLMLIAFLTFISLWASLNASAQESSATLDETIKSLQRKVYNEKKIRGKGLLFNYELLPVSGCSVKLFSYVSDETNYDDQSYTYFSMGEIDPLSVTVKQSQISSGIFALEASFTDDKKDNVVFSHYDLHDANKSYEKVKRTTNKISILIESEEMANRAATAFKHAVKLCGGKVDPF